ncbi:MAG: hypothetical protein M3Y86_00340 [Verrucomicrobiota bacterium]|nr:hypothetical protein [Verrucomicrobiota bacterium]
MVSPFITFIAAVSLFVTIQFARAQQAATPPDQFLDGSIEPALPVNSYGTALAQNEAAIEQARLYRNTEAPANPGVDANGSAIPETEPSTSEDDSFGAQKFLKTQESVRRFVVTGNASVVYTDNVALTRRGTQSDVFGVVDAGVNWQPHLASGLEGTFGLHASVFRYDETRSLDFENFGLNAGVTWSPAKLPGMSFFARYDFTELLNRDGKQILMDHALTIGAQKAVALGRSHGFVFGATASVGLSDPSNAQRSQISAFGSYHLQLTRKLDTDILYRPAVHFYTESGRTDLNQILSWNLRYRLADWADLNATISYGTNISNHGAFDYDVFTNGAGIGLNVRF